MKSKSLLFGSSNSVGRWSSKALKNSLKKNNKSLDLKNHITPHKLPIVHIPNSHIEQHDDSGKLIRIRHYDENGNAYKDVDYDDHGRPDTHKVPHTHIIEIGTIIDRKKGVKEYANR